MANLFVVHLWHPRPKTNSFYNAKRMQNNRDILRDFFTKYDKNKMHPDPLIDDRYAKNRVLYFGKQGTHATTTFERYISIIGNYTIF